MFRGTDGGLPLGVNSGDVEGDALEPEHHEQSLGEGAVPDLGSITASLQSKPHLHLGLVYPTQPRPFWAYPIPRHTHTQTHGSPELGSPPRPRSSLEQVSGNILYKGWLPVFQILKYRREVGIGLVWRNEGIWPPEKEDWR